MSNPAVVVLVRFRSRLPLEEVLRIAEERAPAFRELAGLRQKHYLHDPETGEIGGLYLWDSREALTEYQQSSLRASIAEAYQAEGAPRLDVFRVVMTLRDESA